MPPKRVGPQKDVPPIPSGISIVLEVVTVVAVIVAVVSARYTVAALLVVLLAILAIVTERALKRSRADRMRRIGGAFANSTSGER